MRKRVNDMRRYFKEEKIDMGNKDLKKCLIRLVIRKSFIKIVLKYYFICV